MDVGPARSGTGDVGEGPERVHGLVSDLTPNLEKSW